ncbi:thermonuclease family protein [Marinomonas epiphytica]
MKQVLRKKRQVYLALFLFLYPAISLAQACKANGELEKVAVAQVVDGDTLHLKDGRKIRLIGLNTPEIDYQEGHHQAFAIEAKVALTSNAEQFVWLQLGPDKQDRYGRYLAYLFDEDRNLLASQLLSKGLGYRIAVPPNLSYQACLQHAEKQARDKQLGLWQSVPQWQPKAGFVIGRLTITEIIHTKSSWWLATNRNVRLNLPKSALDYWTAQDVFKLEGLTLEARGWQYYRNSRRPDYQSWVLTIRHPNDLRRLN